MEVPIKIYKKPRLKNPYLITGWPDAGEVGLAAVSYLKRELKAQPLAEIEVHDFCSTPKSVVHSGIMEAMEFTKNEFSYWKNKREGSNDLIIFASEAPDFRRYEFVNILLDLAQKFSVERIYGVGGLYAGVLHTAEPEVVSIVNMPYMREEMLGYDVRPGMDYHGPTSMNGLLMIAAQRRNMECVGLWGEVPHYIAEMPNPKVCLAVLQILTRMLRIEIDFSQIEAQVEYAESQIENLVSYVRGQRPDFDQYLQKLEKGMPSEPTMEEKETFFREIEEFLRRQKDK